MNFIWDYIGKEQGPDIGNIIFNIVIIVLIYALLFFVFIKAIKRRSGYFLLGVSFILTLLSYLFDLEMGLIVVSAVSTCLIAVMLIANIGDLRYYIANPFKRASVKVNKNHVEKIFDRSETYHIIDNTIKALSKAKIGALMTFERTTLLDDFCKNGVKVDAPVSQELLVTIFYPGTRLHDGAVIIHGNIIKSAAVFFTPSTKAFTYKYGSRHRAAIGISEVSDSVTVVVSEETGRVSIAVNGQIESVTTDNFLRVFENYMREYDKENDK